MKKVYYSPEMKVVVFNSRPVCGITASGNATINSSHSVDASSSLSRRGNSSWDDEE